MWEANTLHSSLTDLNSVVFVDGPYRTPHLAAVSANSLAGVEIAATGGLWEVTASLPSHLEASVRRVAACLKFSGVLSGAGGGHGQTGQSTAQAGLPAPPPPSSAPRAGGSGTPGTPAGSGGGRSGSNGQPLSF